MPLELKQISMDRYVVDNEVLEAFSECDFGVLLSFNLILSGPILRSNWGVWSFHPANTFRYRGRPGCFWEYIDGESFGMTLQRLSEEVDGGPVLAQRHLTAPEGRGKTLDEIRFILGTLQLGMITEAISSFQKTGGTFFSSPDTAKSQYHFQRDADKLLPSLKYLLAVIRNLVWRCFRAYG